MHPIQGAFSFYGSLFSRFSPVSSLGMLANGFGFLALRIGHCLVKEVTQPQHGQYHEQLAQNLGDMPATFGIKEQRQNQRADYEGEYSQLLLGERFCDPVQNLVYLFLHDDSSLMLSSP